jgi:hypothetical protein
MEDVMLAKFELGGAYDLFVLAFGQITVKDDMR